MTPHDPITPHLVDYSTELTSAVASFIHERLTADGFTDNEVVVPIVVDTGTRIVQFMIETQSPAGRAMLKKLVIQRIQNIL